MGRRADANLARKMRLSGVPALKSPPQAPRLRLTHKLTRFPSLWSSTMLPMSRRAILEARREGDLFWIGGQAIRLVQLFRTI
jgi:hypothetical protein